MTIREDKLYEIWTAWFTPEGSDAVQEYLAKVGPSAQANGRKALLNLSPVDISSAVARDVGEVCGDPDVDHEASAMGLVEGPSLAAFETFVAGASYADAKPLRDKAIAKFEALHANFAFPPTSK